MAYSTVLLVLSILVLISRGCYGEDCAQVETQNKKLEDYQKMVDQLKIRKMMVTYNETKNWMSLKTDLEVILDHDSEAYKQLQNFQHRDNNPLWNIGMAGNKELIVVLVAGGSGVNMSDRDRCTLLDGAAHRNRVEVVQMLMDHGAELEATAGPYNKTPVIYAAQVGHLVVVRMLKEQGIDLDIADSENDTSLHYASSRGHLEMVRYLVEAGANTTLKNKAGLTPYDRAVRQSRTEVSQYLSQFPH